MSLKVIYEDENLLVIDKPAGVVVFDNNSQKALIKEVLKDYPEMKQVGFSPRYGIVHRLDKDTSGLLLVAKTNEALQFFQNQFKNRVVEKKYLTLVVGRIEEQTGEIKSLIGRSLKNRKKQKAYWLSGPESQRKGLRYAETIYKVMKRYGNDYTLLEVQPKTGRKHQIRCHLAFIGHPIVGDKLYGFKNQKTPHNLKRLFLHAYYLKVALPDATIKGFTLNLPEDLQKVLQGLDKINKEQ